MPKLRRIKRSPYKKCSIFNSSIKLFNNYRLWNIKISSEKLNRQNGERVWRFERYKGELIAKVCVKWVLNIRKEQIKIKTTKKIAKKVKIKMIKMYKIFHDLMI
jgi:hypothetical protein